MKFSESLSDLHVSEVTYQWLRLGLVNRRTYGGCFGMMSKKSAAAHGLQVIRNTNSHAVPFCNNDQRAKAEKKRNFCALGQPHNASLSPRPNVKGSTRKRGVGPLHHPRVTHLISHPPSSLSGKFKGRGDRGLMGKRGGRMAGRGPIKKKTRKDRKSAHARNKRIEKSNGVHALLPLPVVWSTSLVSLARSSSHTLREISRTLPRVKY